jgi:4-hydroxybenzoate polyprenyltransferase
MAATTAQGSLSQAWRTVRVTCEMIKIEHTIFSLPFALMSAFIAARGVPNSRILLWIVIAILGARSAAMAFNRIVDADHDAVNPRTKMRAIPAGLLTQSQVAVFTVGACGLLVLAAWNLNRLAFELSPVALLFALGYSVTKRFTIFSHAFLGLALSIAPMGAWIAVTGKFAEAPLLLAAAVLCWLFGFDIIYALQDTEFDRKFGLQSIPARLGNARALAVSRISHVVMIGFLVAFGMVARLHTLYWLGVALTAALVTYEQLLVKPDDLSKLDFAFFNLNGYISTGLAVMTIGDVLLCK